MQRGTHHSDRALEARLAEGVVVCDGAMGTMLDASGVSIDRCRPELSLSRPDLVRAIHRAYVSAGAEIIETNSFMANRIALARFGLEAAVERINSASVALAREVCNEGGAGVLVAGSVGPAVSPRMARAVDDEAAADAIVEQVQVLGVAGVDLLMFETFGDLRSLVSAISATKEVTDLPIVAQMSFLADGRTIGGDSPEAVAESLDAMRVLAMGVNCALGPAATRPIVDRLGKATDTFLVAQPNAGPPTFVNGRFRYPENEDYFARCAAQFVELGASMVGGCCGTTPRHVEAVARSVRGLRSRRIRRSAQQPPERQPPPPPARAASLQAKFERGEFVVGCELRPPDGTDPSKALDAAAGIRDAGADIVLVGPNSSSRVPMSPLSFALLVYERLGMDCIITATTFERSAISLQADLLGAHSFGLQNVLCRTGAVVPQGEYPSLGTIFEMTSVDLIELLHLLNEARDRAGNHMGRATSFLIGGQVNPSAGDLEEELRQAQRKVEAGCHFLVTAPVFDVADLGRFVERFGEPHVPLLLGVTPLTSVEHAEYLLYERQDVHVPDGLIDRLRRGNARKVGLQLASELIWEGAAMVQGVIVTPASGDGGDGAELLRAAFGVATEWQHVPNPGRGAGGSGESSAPVRVERDEAPEAEDGRES